MLECEAEGFGFLTWAVRVDNLDAVSERVGIEIFDYTVPHADGSLRGWRSVTDGADLPFFIDYPNNGDRIGRWRAMYQRVRHTSHPGDVIELTLGDGPEDDVRQWLGSNALPLRFEPGRAGVHRVLIEGAPEPIVLQWPL